MTSFHVIEDLPLWVEGDLPEAETLRISEHLTECPSCRAVAEALQESQSWLKDAPPLPFDETDFAALRQDVLARLAAEAPARTHARVFRLTTWGSLLATAAALLFVVISSRSSLQKPLPPADASHPLPRPADPQPPGSWRPGRDPGTHSGPRLQTSPNPTHSTDQRQPGKPIRSRPSPGPHRASDTQSQHPHPLAAQHTLCS